MSSVSVVTSINLPFDRKSKRAFVFPFIRILPFSAMRPQKNEEGKKNTRDWKRNLKHTR